MQNHSNLQIKKKKKATSDLSNATEELLPNICLAHHIVPAFSMSFVWYILWSYKPGEEERVKKNGGASTGISMVGCISGASLVTRD